jgi:hypothetical protein
MENDKPKCKLIGEDGNIFNLVSLAQRALKDADQRDESIDMTNLVMACGSYDEALCVIGDYVEIC